RQLLAQLVYYRPHDTFVPRTLAPAEEAVPEEVAVDLDRDLAVAIEERPEVLASARGVRTQQLNERIASNALLPQLDLVGSYGVNGLSGTNRSISTTTLVNRFSPTDLGGGRCIPLGPGEGFICQVPASGSTRPASRASSPRRTCATKRSAMRWAWRRRRTSSTSRRGSRPPAPPKCRRRSTTRSPSRSGDARRGACSRTTRSWWSGRAA